MVESILFSPGGASEVTLSALLTELQSKLEAGGEVSLDAATLAALESVTVTVLNPTADPETGLAKEATLTTLLAELQAKLDEGGTVALDAATLAALESITVSGSVNVDNFPPQDGLTDAELRAADVKVTLDGEQVAISNFPTQTEGLTDAQLRASPVPVSGEVAVSNHPVPQTDALTDAELRATPVPVDTGLATQTDALTDAELRASPVPVSGTVAVDNHPTPQTDALTDAELRATPVPVSGTVSVDNHPTPQTDALTDAELRAAPVPVSGDFGGDPTSETSAVNSTTSTSGPGWVGNTYTGAGEQNDYQYATVSLTVDSAGTLYFDFSTDGTNWSAFPVAGFAVGSGVHQYHAAHKAGRFFRPRFVGPGGHTYFRLTTYYSDVPAQLNSPLSQGVSTESDALTTKAVQFGRNPDGEWVDVAVTGTKTLSPAITNLGPGGVYTSESIDTDLHPTLLLLFGADQPSASNGIQLLWSDTEGFAATRSIEKHTFRQGNIAEGLFVQTRTRARWLRVQYTNGPTPQGYFFINLRMQPVPLVKDVTLASTGKAQTGQQDVDTTASKIASSPLAGRKAIRIRNLASSGQSLFYGFDAGLNIANGDELSEGDSVAFDFDEFVEIWVIRNAGQQGVRCSWTEVG